MDTFITEDGSSTFFSKEFSEHYHSAFGALGESRHIFIDAGLEFISEARKKTNILEMGFGTGLNALLSYDYATTNCLRLNYFGVEAFPIDIQDAKKLNYPEILEINPAVFLKMHSDGNLEYKVSKYFHFMKHIGKIEDVLLREKYFDLVFFDAFSPDSQPDLWTKDIFLKINRSLKKGGILTTYSCKGLVKRNLISCGFSIKKLPGPPGKREFLRATKIKEV
jgi:tRNA U34 5-methylaminomethyl-2-thiouridine-forming methyltransferase MnmC